MNFFEKMTADCEAWEAQNKAGMKAEYPYSSGTMKAYRVYNYSPQNRHNEFEMKESCLEHEYHDFVKTLRWLGIREFTVTIRSTSLMSDLYGYAAEGCTILGLHKIIKKRKCWDKKPETVQGILFRTN